MKHLLSILAALCVLAAPAAAQTIRALSYNTTNGALVAATNVIWTNSFSFSTNTIAAQVRTNLGLGATNSVTFNTLHAEQDASSSIYTLTIGQTNTGFRGTGGGASDFVIARDGVSQFGFFSTGLISYVAHTFSAPVALNYGAGATAVLQFGGIDAATGAAISRTNLGLGATWLTNTNATNFRTAIGIGSANAVSFSTVAAQEIYDSVGNKVIDLENFILTVGTTGVLEWATNQVQVNVPILFYGTNSAATTRTNLGLGSGITTNRTFVSYNGTNYTTNSVSISNGVITGWTQ